MSDAPARGRAPDLPPVPEAEIETVRLILRHPVLADAPRLFEFLGDAEAMRHTRADATLRECRRRVGYAPWTIVKRADGCVIGWGGLLDDPFVTGWGVELAYFFHPTAWGRSYATELAMACTMLADDVLLLPELRAFAQPRNAASRRVLEKAGFEAMRFVPELERLLYRRVPRAGRPDT